MELCYLHCARSIHINTDRKQLKGHSTPRTSVAHRKLYMSLPWNEYLFASILFRLREM